MDSDPTTYTGYRAHRRSRVTGTTVVLLDGHAAGMTSPADGDGRWAVLCDQHGGIIATDTQAEARSLMADPTDWCPVCQGTHDHLTD